MWHTLRESCTLWKLWKFFREKLAGNTATCNVRTCIAERSILNAFFSGLQYLFFTSSNQTRCITSLLNVQWRMHSCKSNSIECTKLTSSSDHHIKNFGLAVYFIHCVKISEFFCYLMKLSPFTNMGPLFDEIRRWFLQIRKNFHCVFRLLVMQQREWGVWMQLSKRPRIATFT